MRKRKKIPHTIHQYEHDPRADSYGLEAAEVLGQDPKTVFKTLLFCLNGEPKNLAVAIIPVDQKLNLKLAAKAAKAKRPIWLIRKSRKRPQVMSLVELATRQKKALPTFLHESAAEQDTICVSAGKRGLEIELAPRDLLSLTRGQFAPLCL